MMKSLDMFCKHCGPSKSFGMWGLGFRVSGGQGAGLEEAISVAPTRPEAGFDWIADELALLPCLSSWVWGLGFFGASSIVMYKQGCHDYKSPGYHRQEGTNLPISPRSLAHEPPSGGQACCKTLV